MMDQNIPEPDRFCPYGIRKAEPERFAETPAGLADNLKMIENPYLQFEIVAKCIQTASGLGLDTIDSCENIP